MPKAAFERRPPGLDLEYAHIWDNAVKELKADGLWTLSKYPLLKLYIRALLDADQAAEEDDRINEDRAAKRAMALADQLGLSARGRRSAGLAGNEREDEDEAPKSAIEQLASRRLRSVG